MRAFRRGVRLAEKGKLVSVRPVSWRHTSARENTRVLPTKSIAFDYQRFEPRRRTPLSVFSSPVDSVRLASSSKSKAGPSHQRAPARQVKLDR